jgi:nucleotide-binding universal stress UspA family protein
MDKIVVGVDGSPASAAALRYALDEARTHGARLVVASAWHVPAQAYSGGVPVPFPDISESLEKDSRATVVEMLEGLEDEDEAEAEGVELDQVVREGQPAEVLLGLAADADLIVVGSRGRGGFSGLLLGSVSQQVTHHAACPVTIVRS